MTGERGKQVEAADPIRFRDLELIGGRLCLDFVNTVDPRVGEQRREYLTAYADLVEWSRVAHALSGDQAPTLEQRAAREPDAAAAVLTRAIALRETLYRVLSAVAEREAPAPGDLEALHAAYVEMLAHGALVPARDGVVWRWPERAQGSGQAERLDALLWPIIRSAVELLTSPEARRVKACPGLGDCGWLFLDTSKNGRRRWCSMEGCGSRSKMRSYYARTHGQTERAER